MKNVRSILLLVCFSSCYFGANESGGHIIQDFYLIGWDERDWQIVYSANGEIYDPEKVIIRHDVFAVGHNDNFIVAKQHPCQNVEPHLMHRDTLKPDKAITNYYIIDIGKGNEAYQLYQFNDEQAYNDKRIALGVPKDLTFTFNDEKLE
jgi:hypothetical protein